MTTTAQDAIKTYLEALGSAKPEVDREAVKALKAQIKSESDPIAKLKLLAALEDAEQPKLPDTSGLEAVFIAEAASWAQSEGIPASAFQALGVADDVLTKAGFKVEGDKATKPTKAKGGTRAPRLSDDEVMEFVAHMPSDGWTIPQLATRIAREPATTRNYVLKLVEAGKIADLGDDPNHSGRGRAAHIYKIA